MKKDRSYVMIKISFIIIMISFVTFYRTHAFFTDSEELSTSINITTGTLDIQVKDSTRNTVGNQSYILNLNQTTKSQMIGNLSVNDIGSLSSNLSAKVIIGGPVDVVNLIKIYIVDSSGNETLLSGNYSIVDSIHNSGNTFGVKILYTGTLPFKTSELEVNIELRATQPNDVFYNPKMFSDVQEIRIVPIQIATEGSETPIKGPILLNKNEWLTIDILLEKSEIKNISGTIYSNGNNPVEYVGGNKLKFKINGNFENATIVIAITTVSGETYYIERNIQLTK